MALKSLWVNLKCASTSGKLCVLLGEQLSVALVHIFLGLLFSILCSISSSVFTGIWKKTPDIYQRLCQNCKKVPKRWSQLHTSPHPCTWAEAELKLLFWIQSYHYCLPSHSTGSACQLVAMTTSQSIQGTLI